MRTKNTLINVVCGMGGQVITILVQFIVRGIFIKLLGIEYLGVSGLFGNILMLLSLAELGVGNAIIYSLYKPLADKNESKIKALMDLYAKAYHTIAFVVLIVGLAFIPLLKYIIRDTPNISENLIVLYLLYLANSLMTYFFAYKRSLIIADQKEYIVTLVTQCFTIVSSIIQIIFLYLTRNFLIYLIIQIVGSLLCNIYISYKANTMYPILQCKEKTLLEADEKQAIWKNIKALLIYKIGALLTIGLDNIIISSFVGIAAVGIYSNYTLITDKITGILGQIFSATTASVGNLNVEADTRKKEEIYHVMLFVAFWLFGFSSVCIYILINPFIALWAGKDYLLSESVVIAMVFCFYFIGIHNPTMIFRNTMGLYVQGKYRPLIGALVNAVTSIIMVKPFGVLGVVLGTLMSRLLVLSWYEPLVIYKYRFNKSPLQYFKKYVVYCLLTVIAAGITKLCCLLLPSGGIWHFIIKMMLCIIIPNFVFFLCCFKMKEFNYIREITSQIWKKIYRSLGKKVIE